MTEQEKAMKLGLLTLKIKEILDLGLELKYSKEEMGKLISHVYGLAKIE